MTHGLQASDWIVRHTTGEGTVECDEYRGRFRVQPSGDIRIIWRQGPGPDDHGTVSRAAEMAIEQAIRPISS
jgi:hypothetical protein